MTTRIRLPTAPVPPPRPAPELPSGVVPRLAALVVVREGSATVGATITRLRGRCAPVLVVDDGSKDGTAEAAEAAGARVLRFPAPQGRGPGLRAGFRLLRELGAIGAVVPGSGSLDEVDLDRLAMAWLRAPEALLLGVGPGERIAGTEWDEAAALARGEDPAPRPTFRPPRSAGAAGVLESWFERLAETRFAHPWGGPRVVPLQAVLRRDLREDGAFANIELLAECVADGVPTVEVELSGVERQAVPACRKPVLRLISRWVPRIATRTAIERLGLGGGYAPPTTSPLLLAIGLSVVFLTGGCAPKHIAATADERCAGGLSTWPGGGDEDRAWQVVREWRAGAPSLWVGLDVRVEAPGLVPTNVYGTVMRLGDDRFRLRLQHAAFALPLLDFLRGGAESELALPMIRRRYAGPLVELAPWLAAIPDAPQGLPLGALVALVDPLPDEADVRWQSGSCAVLERLGPDGRVAAAYGFELRAAHPPVLRSERHTDGQSTVDVRFDEWAPVDGGRWAHRIEVEGVGDGLRAVATTINLRTDGLTPSLFLLEGEG